MFGPRETPNEEDSVVVTIATIASESSEPTEIEASVNAQTGGDISSSESD